MLLKTEKLMIWQYRSRGSYVYVKYKLYTVSYGIFLIPISEKDIIYSNNIKEVKSKINGILEDKFKVDDQMKKMDNWNGILDLETEREKNIDKVL